MTTACLSEGGIQLFMSDLFMMDVMDGSIEGSTCFRTLVGIGSKQQDFEFPDMINFETSFSSTSVNNCSGIILGPTNSDTGIWSTKHLASDRLFLILAILSVKYSPNLSAHCAVEEWLGSDVFFYLCRRVFAI